MLHVYFENKLVKNGIADASRNGRPRPSCERAVLLLDNGIFLFIIFFNRILEQFLWICFFKQVFFRLGKLRSVLITLNTHSQRSSITSLLTFLMNFENSLFDIFFIFFNNLMVSLLTILMIVSY